ncbi:MAG: GNAT family N-acetyltransferase [Fimbriimonadaceae bacterium]|nr:GNAT family N-acetyltransferase [Fimbriimonadaceae bacterium]
MTAETVSLRPVTEADLATWESRFPVGTVFNSRDWFGAWLATYARRPVVAELRVNGGACDDEPVGAWMLESAGGIVRGAAALGCDAQAPRWREPLSAGQQAEFTAQIANALAHRPDVHLVDLREVPGSGGTVPDSPTVALALPATFEAYLGQIPSHVRRDVRRGIGAVEAVPPDERGPAFADLVRLHGARWRRRGLPGAFFGRRLVFHRRLIETPSVRMYRCVQAGRTVGVLYTLRDGEAVRYYQAGIDASAAKISPGTAMIGAAIRDAIADGYAIFDFLRGDERYKQQWRPQLRAQNGRFLLQGRSAMGRIAMPIGRTLMALEQSLRARMEPTGHRAPHPASGGGECPSNG